MGNCMTRLEAELETSPNYHPQQYGYNSRKQMRKDVGLAYERREKFVQEYNANGAPLRRETQSGIPGLTYDQAGRPV